MVMTYIFFNTKRVKMITPTHHWFSIPGKHKQSCFTALCRRNCKGVSWPGFNLIAVAEPGCRMFRSSCILFFKINRGARVTTLVILYYKKR